MKNFKRIIVLMVLSCFFCQTAEAVKSVVKGDPELLWRTPLGKENIENTPYNRCLLIKAMKPGTSAEQISQNTYEILAEYTANLYAQSVKISAYIEEESKKEKAVDFGKLNDEISIIKKLILRRLSDISRRVNIINSFEAGTNMLQALTAMSVQGNEVYGIIDDCCTMLSVNECQGEKACTLEKGACVSVK